MKNEMKNIAEINFYFEKRNFEETMNWLSQTLDEFYNNLKDGSQKLHIKIEHPKPFCIVYEWYSGEHHICNVRYEGEFPETTVEWCCNEMPEDIFEDWNEVISKMTT